jgi:hypothetical protein
MKSTIIILLMAIIMTTGVMAENCFTAVNAPGTDRYYWKATSYDLITSTNDISRTPIYENNPGIGPGTLYTMRVDKDCFNTYLLSSNTATGISSGAMFIQKDNDDYKDSAIAKNTLYTISKISSEVPSTNTVQSITTGNIKGINYLQRATNIKAKYPDYDTIKTGLCNGNYKVTEQVQRIITSVQDAHDYTNSLDYTIIITSLSRDCGVPTRIIKGISEGNFNGIDLSFEETKTHHWIEYYDQGWHTIDPSEQIITSPTSIETSCIDNQDNDNDGKIDCRDPDCSNYFYCQGGFPTTIKYNNVLSTPMSSLNQAWRVQNLVVGNEYGDITWKDQSLDLRGKNLDPMIDILQNKVIITGFNKPATIKLVGINIPSPIINKDGSPCQNCKITGSANNMITFTMEGDGTYTVTQTPTTPTAPTNATLPPAPTTGPSITEKLKTIKGIISSLSLGAKAAIILAIILVVYLYIKHRNKKKYFGRP